MKSLLLPLLLIVANASPQGATQRQARGSGASKRLEALKRTGDATRGKDAYAVCAQCHLWSGAGRNDGLFPQLAGQHPTVIIKQLADIRSGLRDNPLMYPYAATLTDPQEIADIAAYIGTLELPESNGWGPGRDLALGQQIYEANCVACHGPRGLGNAEAFFPVIAGQHYKYLLRQLIDIQEGSRRNANPAMAKMLQQRSKRELDAVADYVSRLRVTPADP